MEKDQIQGKGEQALGKLTGDEELQAQGEQNEAKGDIKDKLDDVKDAVSDKIGDLKDKFNKKD